MDPILEAIQAIIASKMVPGMIGEQPPMPNPKAQPIMDIQTAQRVAPIMSNNPNWVAPQDPMSQQGSVSVAPPVVPPSAFQTLFNVQPQQGMAQNALNVIGSPVANLVRRGARAYMAGQAGDTGYFGQRSAAEDMAAQQQQQQMFAMKQLQEEIANRARENLIKMYFEQQQHQQGTQDRLSEIAATGEQARKTSKFEYDQTAEDRTAKQELDREKLLQARERLDAYKKSISDIGEHLKAVDAAKKEGRPVNVEELINTKAALIRAMETGRQDGALLRVGFKPEMFEDMIKEIDARISGASASAPSKGTAVQGKTGTFTIEPE